MSTGFLKQDARGSGRRLTRRDRARRPVRLAAVGAAVVLGAGVGGHLVAPWLGPLIALAVGVAYVTAVLTRDLGILRIAASEQRALETLLPLRADHVYPLNPATLPPENALTLVQQVVYRRPTRVLEFGSGVSTLLMCRALQQIGGDGRTIHSLEHDAYWRGDSQRMIDAAGLQHIATIHHAPLVETAGLPVRWYDLSKLPADAGPFDLVLVDGPEGGSRDPLARYGGFAAVRDRLAPGAVILLDDGLREGETEIARRWQALEPRLRATFHRSHNGMWVFELPA
ncbi:MAG: O-methyltransferase [Planctomycetota bacterium]